MEGGALRLYERVAVMSTVRWGAAVLLGDVFVLVYVLV